MAVSITVLIFVVLWQRRECFTFYVKLALPSNAMILDGGL